MNALTSIAIGVLSSFVASIVFLLALSKLRPKLEISPVISKTQDLDERSCYIIKVVNKGRRPVVDVKAELRLQVPQSVPVSQNFPGNMRGVVLRNRRISLNRPEVFEIKQYDRSDGDARYAHRFVTYDDVDAIWVDDNRTYLSFRIHVTDSLSGFGRVFSRQYHTKRNSIKEGSFEFGDSMEVR